MKIELVDAIRKQTKETVNELHTAIPGKILAINYDKGTCSVQPYALLHTATGDRLKYPALYNVPIVVPQSSIQDACIAYPIVPGDTCLLIVAEGTLDYWRYEQVTELDTKFSLSNAVCIPGLTRNFNPCFKEAANDGAVILKYGAGKFKLTNTTMTISARDLVLEAGNNLTLTAGNTVSVSGKDVGMTGSGNVSLNASGNASVNASGNASVTGGSAATVSGATATLNGSGGTTVSSSGNVTITGSRVDIN